VFGGVADRLEADPQDLFQPAVYLSLAPEEELPVGVPIELKPLLAQEGHGSTPLAAE